MSKKHDLSYIRDFIQKKGFELKSDSYNSKKSPLKVLCSRHGEFNTNFSNFSHSRYGCPKCGHKAGGYKNSLSLEEVMKIVEEIGYTVNFKEYHNAHKKISVICSKHGAFEMSFTNLRFGKKCPKCSLESVSIKNTLSEDEVVKRIEDKNCELIGPYLSAKDPFLAMCKIHGQFQATLQNFTYGYGCQKCSKGRSKQQDELFEFINGYYADASENNRSVISPLELDIYIPSINLAIEYCGLRWHSEKFKKDKNYHINKMKDCNKQNIRLITIFEDEWLEKNAQVKGFLKSVLQKNEIIVFARKCIVEEISKNKAIDFLNENHIQGSTTFKIAIGLVYENNLVALITGNKHHRQNHDDALVLNRLVFKANVSVTGGSSKLLKQLILYAQKHKYSRIVSWSDNRWSEGNVYKKLGFELKEDLVPDYSYVDKYRRMSKQSNKKANLLKKGAVGNTESEMSKSLGYQRIWDCGKKRWELNINGL